MSTLYRTHCILKKKITVNVFSEKEAKEKPAQRNTIYSDHQHLVLANERKDDFVPRTITFLLVQSGDQWT